MSSVFLYMLQLLKSAIWGIEPPPPSEEIEWSALYEEAEAHRVLPVIFRESAMLPILAQNGGETISNQWKGKVFAAGLRQMQQNHCLCAVIEKFEEESIKAVLFKGALLAKLYSNAADRETVDADILIDECDMTSAMSVLEEMGYVHYGEQSSDNEETFSNGELTLELHTRLWEEAEGDRYTRLCSLNIGLPENSVRASVLGKSVWTLNPQDMLFYMIYHMVKHFFVCGIGARYLSDLTLYINHYADEIDWSRFWRETDSLEYTTFAKIFIYLCKKYMGLREDCVEAPEMSADDVVLAEDMLLDIAEAGHNGRRSLVRYKAGRVLRIYYENEDITVPRSKVEIIRRVFFPSRSELKNRRTVSKMYSRISIVAWFQNLLYFYSRWKESRQQRCSLNERISCAQNRLFLLNELDLVKKND